MDKSLLINSDPNIEDQNVLQIGRLPARATVIPAQERGVYYRNKEKSNFLRSLNGDYKFRYLLSDSFKDFYRPELDDSDFDTIDVPSMWQYRGYGKPEYPNVRYSIPFSPPFVKKQNPVGLYRRHFNVDTVAGRSILHFSGVDNAYYVYLNGELVGFSKGSRLAAEFDVTSLIRKGDNLLAVKVFTYSDATYLEDQDMLLASGIFRDVYLIESDRDTLWDYRVTTTYDSISVKAELAVCGDYSVRFTLDGESVEYPAAETVEHTFVLKEPRLWNAELPELYDLNIELLRGSQVFEVHSKRVGIMHTRVEGNKFLVNETPIYIKGINRHENDAWNGRAIRVADIERDLKMIKANGLNAIRMSHYTNDPATYEIAAELGIYLMDETDLETHGAHIANGDQGYLSKSPEWLAAYMDRTTRMLEINKNETAIFLRSYGNEVGNGENIHKCLDAMRAFDPTREVRAPRDYEHNHFRYIGYYPMSVVEELPEEGYPVMAVEYAHAMGNSPGCLEDYWDYNYTHENMLGGFVWEFRSHGFGARDENGNVYYKYGGDFDDAYHWCDFTLDGYCMSDGTPKPGWFELGAVSFAAYTTFDGKHIRVKNTNDFKTLSYLTAYYEITEDGRQICRKKLELPEMKPHEWAELDADISVSDPTAGARYYLNVYYYENDRPVNCKQFELGVLKAAEPYLPKARGLQVGVQDHILKISGSGFACEFTEGMLSYLRRGDDVLLSRPMKLNFHRAYTDNDGIPGLYPRHILEWENALVRAWYFNLYDIDVIEADDKVTVITTGKMTADSTYGGFACRIYYDVHADGVITVTVNGEPFGSLPRTLPKIGVMFTLDKAYENASWLGRGPRESYPDMKAAAPIGIYSKNVEELNVMYDHPQETGNHENTRCLTLGGEGKSGISFIGSDEFAYSYHDFSLDDLTDAAHKNELVKSKDANYLYIDYRTRGLGSRSCGPEPEEKYELRPHSFSFTFAISPSELDEAIELSEKDLGKKTHATSDTYVYVKPEKIKELLDCDI